jgi:type IX secretion system PorP/SprF family membrane protein
MESIFQIKAAMSSYLRTGLLLTICMFFLCRSLNAQQLNPSETQFFINPYLANPSLAGMIKNELIVNTAFRSQMENLPGSPKTLAFTADYRSSNNVGLGLNFNSQQAGLLKQTNLLLSYAYHIPMTEEDNEYLHLGFSMGFSKDILDYNSMVGDIGDPIVIGYNGRTMNWNVDAGIAYMKNGFCVQLAAPNLNRTMNKKHDFMADYPIYYAAVNYEMAISESITLNPKIAFRGIQNYNNILDLGLQVQFKEPFGLSTMYHSNQSYSIGASYTYQKQWELLCLYNTPTQSLKGLQNGIFEIGLRFRFESVGISVDR